MAQARAGVVEIDINVVEPPAFGEARIRGGSVIFIVLFVQKKSISQVYSRKKDDAPHPFPNTGYILLYGYVPIRTPCISVLLSSYRSSRGNDREQGHICT